MPASPHFITGGEFDADRLARLLARAAELKAALLSRHAALIGLRTGDEAELGGLAEHASVPVVNMLSPLHHPCQAPAGLQTLAEALGSLQGRVVTYVGDGNDVARSLLESLVSSDWQDG